MRGSFSLVMWVHSKATACELGYLKSEPFRTVNGTVRVTVVRSWIHACHVNKCKCFATPEDSKIEHNNCDTTQTAPEIHAKMVRSCATPATCVQASLIRHASRFLISLQDVAIGSSAATVPVEVAQLSPEDQTEHNKELKIETTATFT